MMRVALLDRIKKHSIMLYKNFKRDLHFSAKLAFVRAIADISQDLLHWHALSNVLYSKKNRIVIGYLKRQLQDVIIEFEDYKDPSSYQANAPLWMCWLQGIENAPELCKKCMEYISINSNNHPLYLVSSDTLPRYITIPEYIKEKWENGSMGAANYADYIRCSLLYSLGGIWVDSTVLVSKPIPDAYFDRKFFTCKTANTNDERYNAKGRWTTYLIGGWKNSKLFAFLTSAFEEYWKKHDYIIDYLLFDYLIEVAYNSFEDVRKEIDNVPPNNPYRGQLNKAMSQDKGGDFYKFLCDDTIFYKLSYKANYGREAANGEKSAFSAFLSSNPKDIVI